MRFTTRTSADASAETYFGVERAGLNHGGEFSSNERSANETDDSFLCRAQRSVARRQAPAL